MTVQSKGGAVSAGTDREGVTREWTIHICNACGWHSSRESSVAGRCVACLSPAGFESVPVVPTSELAALREAGNRLAEGLTSILGEIGWSETDGVADAEFAALASWRALTEGEEARDGD